MGIKLQLREIDLLKKLVNETLFELNYYPYRPQKADFKRRNPINSLCRSLPEDMGVSSTHLAEFLHELQRDNSMSTQGVMITRKGHVILEAAFRPYDLDTWRITHSLSKSLVGIATGIAIEEGFFQLNDSVASIFLKKQPLNLRKKVITVEHLLTMTSGIHFNEVGSVLDGEWTKDILDSPCMFEPGERFHYNSMNTYLLSAIIQETTNKTLMEYLSEKLFQPMGIQNIFWESSPENKTKGGWGLYISLEDRTKIAQLFLTDGVWNGQQIVSKKWLRKMSTKQVDTPLEQNVYGYGYQGWIGPRRDSFIWNGVLGQNTIIFKDIDMVISIVSSNVDMFVTSPLMNLIEKYFGISSFNPDKVLERTQVGSEILRNTLQSLSFQKEFDTITHKSKLHGGWEYPRSREKRHRKSNKISLENKGIEIPNFTYEVEGIVGSVIPLFIQVLQVNFSRGITRIQFVKERESFYLRIQEQDVSYEIPFGLNGPICSVLNFHGENYQIAATGVLKKTEEDKPVLKMQICFLETTNCRNIHFYFQEDGLLVKMTEVPDLYELSDKALSFLKIAMPSQGMELIKNTDIVKKKLKHLMKPEFFAKRIVEM